MSREKSVKNYYMRIGDFAYDPVVNKGNIYIRVAYVRNEMCKSLHNSTDLKIVSSSMPEELVMSYWETLKNNRSLILEGVKHA